MEVYYIESIIIPLLVHSVVTEYSYFQVLAVYMAEDQTNLKPRSSLHQ